MNAIAKPSAYKVSTSAGTSMDILSRQWMSRPADERFLSLEDLQRSLKARSEATREMRLKPRDIEVFAPELKETDTRDAVVTKSQQLMFGLPGGDVVTPTNWAFGQVAGLAKAPGAYLRTLPTPIVADALSYGLRYNREDEVKLFADQRESMAVTGPDYGRIFNWEVAEAVRLATGHEQGDNRWKVPGVLDWSTGLYNPDVPVTAETTTLFANDRSLFIFLCQDMAPIEVGKLPDGSPDLMFRGFYVTNSEVGAGSLKLGAMYLRAVCQNRILWGVEQFEEITMRHTRLAPMRFMEQARPALKSFANGSARGLKEGVERAKRLVVADNKEAALDFLGNRNMSRKRAMAIFDRIVDEERQGDTRDRPVSAWEACQGITAQARDEPNSDTRMELELDAKRILDRVIK